MYPNDSTKEKKFATRERIIRSALTLIAEGGTEKFTASNLIAHAQISKGALYHHFNTLEDVLMAALNYRRHQRISMAEQNYSQHQDLKTFLEAFFKEILPFSTQTRFVSVLLFFNEKGLFEEKFRKELCKSATDFTSRIGQIIQHFYPRTIESEKLQALSNVLLFTLEGVSAHGVMQQEPKRFEATWRWVITSILKELAEYES